MTIATRTLKAGMKLEVTYKGKRHTCAVTKTKDGLRFFVDGGKTEYKSLSGAGKSLHGSRSIGGYGFWSLAGETGETPKTPAKKQPAKKTNASIATDAEMAAEVKLAGGAKKVAAASGRPPRWPLRHRHLRPASAVVCPGFDSGRAR